MKIQSACVIALIQLYSVLGGAEVEFSDRETLVAIQPDETLRKHIISIFGDLNQYRILWIHPERVVHVAALCEKDGKKGKVYEVLFWREGLRIKQVTRTSLSTEKAKLIIDSFDRLWASAEKQTFENEDYKNPDRKLLFKRFENGNTNDWKSLSIRSNSKNFDFQRIGELMLPKVDNKDKADVIEFLNGGGSG